MHIKRFIQLAGIPAAVALAVVSCGGGSTSQVGAAAGGTAAGSAVGVSSGPITGFGSVFVNGVEFDSSGAQVVINGSAATPSDLKVGMMVQVDGNINANGSTGTATKIAYNDEVKGVVDSVDTANNSLVVMGQSVQVDSMTVFHGASGLADLKVGNVVEVSGMVDSSGTIHATRIEIRSVSFTAGSLLNVRGQVSNLDKTNSTFDIGAQTVNYANADLNGVPAGLSNGMIVEVKSTQGLNAGGQLVASAIEGISDNIKAASGDEMELRGLVTAFTSVTDFAVNGQPVTTTSSTRFEHGSASTIALNARIEVEGTVNASGVLVAHQLNIEPRPGIEIVADVQAVDPTAGTLTVMGQQFTVDANTTYRDESSMQARFFRIKDIAIGDRLDVRGYESAGTLIATRVERLNAPAGAPVELKAGVSALSSPDLQVMNVSVTTDGATAFRLGESPVAPAAFFAAVATGDVVDVRGSLTGDGAIQATSVGRGDH